MQKAAIVLVLRNFVLLQFLKLLEIPYNSLGGVESSLLDSKFMAAEPSLEACSNLHLRNDELTEFSRTLLLHSCS